MEENQSPLLPPEHLESLREIENGYWWYQGRIHWAKALIRAACAKKKVRPLHTYADLGCGTGGFATEISKEFNFEKILLVDGDSQMNPTVPPSGKFQVQNLTQLKLPWKPDFISCMDVIEHLKEDSQFLKKVWEQLQPQGLLILSVPALPLLFSDWDKKLGHYRRYTKHSLKRILIDSGFRILECQYMWSALLAASPYRKFKKYNAVEFETVSPFTNKALIQYATWEQKLSRFLKIPLGTSLIVGARRED